MDLTESIAPKSDQLDAVDLVPGPRTFTITEVTAGSAEQPFNFHLAEFPRVWRPSKSMRRVIVAAWGPKTAAYAGRSLTLFCNPEIKFGGEKVGGIQISHMSDLPGGKRLSTPLIISKGKSAMFTVEPLVRAAQPPAPTPADVAACTDLDDLLAMFNATSDRELRAIIRARKIELTEPADDQPLIPGASS